MTMTKCDYIERLAARTIKGDSKEWGMDIEAFDWVPGVGLFGLYKAYEATGCRTWLDYLIGWAGRHLREADKKRTVNSTAPMLTIVCLYQETGNQEFLKASIQAAEYLLNKAPITREGGLEHTVTEAGKGFSEQIWADTLFMACLFLAKLGVVTGEKRYTEFALKQLIIHYRLLSDGKGLYFHGWNCAAKNHMSAVRWGRANAWILLASMYMLSWTGNFEERPWVEDAVKKHAARLREVQTKSGAFTTILDENDSYKELSATAGIAAGLILARQQGLLDGDFDKVIKRCVQAVENAMDEGGTLKYVSTGTPVMESAQDYKKIPYCPTLYGQGLALIMFAQLREARTDFEGIF